MPYIDVVDMQLNGDRDCPALEHTEQPGMAGPLQIDDLRIRKSLGCKDRQRWANFEWRPEIQPGVSDAHVRLSNRFDVVAHLTQFTGRRWPAQ